MNAPRRSTHVAHPRPSARLSVETPSEEMPSARSLLKTAVFGVCLAVALIGAAALIAFVATR